MTRTHPTRRRPGSLDELLQAATDAALTVSGADRSNWTGQLQNTRHVRGVPKSADAIWEQGLRLDYRYVMAPLREIYAVPGARHDAQELVRYRRAVETLFHEHVHLMSAHGTDHTEVESYMRPTEVQALEEGVTEAYAFATVDRFIDVLGIEEVAPGITEVPVPDSLTPEATVLTMLAGQVSSEIPGDEVLRRLAVVNPRDKWATLALLISDDSNPEARQRLGQVMWTTYASATKDPATATRTLQNAHAELRKR
jgi:hypothetical protein